MNKEEAEIVASALSVCSVLMEQEVNLLKIKQVSAFRIQYYENEVVPNIKEAYEIIKREYYKTLKIK